MEKTKKNKDLEKLDIAELEDIIQTPQSEPEPQQKFEATIQMGKCDEMIKKIISEENKE